MVTLIGCLMVCCGNMTAIWVTGMVGGLVDLGCLLFVDFPGDVNFSPGAVVTVISGLALLLSFRVWLSSCS